MITDITRSSIKLDIVVTLVVFIIVVEILSFITAQSLIYSSQHERDIQST